MLFDLFLWQRSAASAFSARTQRSDFEAQGLCNARTATLTLMSSVLIMCNDVLSEIYIYM